MLQLSEPAVSAVPGGAGAAGILDTTCGVQFLLPGLLQVCTDGEQVLQHVPLLRACSLQRGITSEPAGVLGAPGGVGAAGALDTTCGIQFLSRGVLQVCAAG